MKKTLLVDTNRAAVPIFQALSEMGHEVWVVGSKPTEPLAKMSANYVPLDYSNADQLAALVKEESFDFIVPGCTDISYRVCSEINKGRYPGIDAPERIMAINSKNEFRKKATDIGLLTPRVLTSDEAVNAETIIVKPVDSFSGRGMTVLKRPCRSELCKAVETARRTSPTGVAVIEEFITGQLFSHSAFVYNGEVIEDFVVQEDCTTNQFTVDTSRVALDFATSMIESLRASVLRLVSSCHLTNGLIHSQFIVHSDNCWIVEVTRRCPGDLYSLLIEFSTGYPYAASYVAAFVGEKPSMGGKNSVEEMIIRHTASASKGTSLWGFQFAEPVDIRQFVPLATAGDFIAASPYGRAGLFFFRSYSVAQHDRLYRRLLDGNLYSFSWQ